MPDYTINAAINLTASGASAALNSTAQAAEKAAKSTKNASISMADLKAGFDIVGNAIGKLSQAYDAVITPTLNYAAQVRDLARASGASAEASSVMISAAGDAGIAFDTLQRAAEGAAKRGIALNVETMAELSDEYLAIQDPVSRSDFLLNKFGQSGLDMAKLLEKGSGAISDAADEAERLGMVLSETDVKAARALEEQMDDLAGQMEALKIKTGNALIPVLNDAAEGANQLLNFFPGIEQAMRKHGDQAVKVSKSYSEYTKEINRLAEASRFYYVDVAGNLVQKGTGIVVESNYLMTESAFNAAQAVEAQTAAIEAQSTALELLSQDVAQVASSDYEEMAQSSWQVVEAVEASENAVHALRTNLSGVVGDEMERFKTSQDELTTKAGEYSEKIAILEGRTWLSRAQKQELIDTRDALGEVNTAIIANAEAHKEAINATIFDLASQTLSEGGLTGEELGALTNLGSELGLIDEATRKVTERWLAADEQFKTGKLTLEEFNEVMGYIADTADGQIDPALKKAAERAGTLAEKADMLDGKEVSMTVFTDFVALAGGDTSVIPRSVRGARAEGGNVEAGEAYMVGENGPEVFVPGRSGHIVNNTTVNLAAQVSGDVDAEALAHRVAAIIKRRLA